MKTDTPETDQWRKNWAGESQYADPIVEDAIELMAKLELERDKRQFQLNRIFHWIESRNQYGFIDSKSYLENLDIIWDRMYDKLDNAISDHKQADTDTLRALHERNEARVQRDHAWQLLSEAMQYAYALSDINKNAQELVRKFEALELTPGQIS